ncbi:unnamed protein product [Ascophyllum nodosum]
MLCVDDVTRFKFIRFLKHKSDAVKEHRELVAKHIAPVGIKVGTVRTDGGGDFQGKSQSLLKELGIKRETTPPHTPQYNGLVDRVIGLLRDKTVALLRGMTAGKSDRLWAEAMNCACKMSNRCTTTSLNPGVSPYELWVGHRPTFDHGIPFGTVGYMRRPKPEQKLAPHRAKCIDTNYPRRVFRRVEHETGRVLGPEGATLEELEAEKVFVSVPEADESREDSSDDECEPELDKVSQSGTHQVIPAAVRKLYDSFTGAPQPITQSRTRSGRNAASLQAPMHVVDVNHLPPESTTLREAQASPEGPDWQRARKRKMKGQIAR